MAWVTYRPNRLGLAILFCLLSAQDAAADLDSVVRKYQNIEVHRSHQARLQEYDGLINYFSALPYFKVRRVISPEFIKALIIAESAGNPRARSGKNARGLGQIIYSTGLQAARELAGIGYDFHYINEARLADLQADDLYDPAINILLTCYLIAKYNHIYDGRLELVLSAWNAGENLKVLKQGKPAGYPETRELIGKVNGFYLFLLRQRSSLIRLSANQAPASN